MNFRLCAALLFGGLIFGQTAEVSRILRFSPDLTVREFQDVATAIRSVSEIRDFTFDDDQRTASVHGPERQVELAEWLCRELDPVAQQQPASAPREFRLAKDDVARVIVIRNAKDIQGFQEMATATRSLGEIRRVFTYNRPFAVIMRATPEQLELAGWMFSELDRPAAPNRTGRYTMPGAGDENIVRLFYNPSAASVQEFQMRATLVRAISDIRRVFTYNPMKAIAARGTQWQMDLAEWLFTEIDRKSQPSAKLLVSELRIPFGDDNVVRIFRPSKPLTTEQIYSLAREAGKAAGTGRVYALSQPPLIAVRGTQVQIDTAQQAIEDREQ